MTQPNTKSNPIHHVVQSGYAELATHSDSCCDAGSAATTAQRMGYTDQEVASEAADGNLGVGCGNPGALAALKPGETVVDLGSGAGFDALLAAPKLGPDGRFIGVDMTPEMLAKARRNAVNAGYAQTVEFREGLIEALPITSNTVDVVISNCVINLSPDKPAVFSEAFRVLRSGGRLAVSDIVLTQPLPELVVQSEASWIACISGALTEEEYLEHLAAAGFVDVEFTRKPAACVFDLESPDPMLQRAREELGADAVSTYAETVYSYSIWARKP